ncbi:GSCOCG00008541001-RA-CDS [Cotesia congregata]|nr:GSCOCG00008541001-RA-CDS [Cotesia congregata]
MDTNNSLLTTFLLNNLEETTIDINRIMYNGSSENYTDFFINNDTLSSSVVAFQSPETNDQQKLNKTSKICNPPTSTTTEEPFDDFGPPDGVEYIFVPLGVIIFVIILSAVVLIIIVKNNNYLLKNCNDMIVHGGEEGEDDWETELLDEGFGGRQRRQGYQSIDNEENTELFGH